MDNQYFKQENFHELIGNFRYALIEIIRTDAYHEEKIYAKIKATGEVELMGAIAIQLSLVGFGNKNRVDKQFGSVRYNDEIIDIKSKFNEWGVKCDSTLNSNLNEDDLTPRRIIRFFRFIIFNFIRTTGKNSYLYRKYCPLKNEKLSAYIFPGAEHMLDPKEEDHNEYAKILLKTYQTLDNNKNSNISDRISRVLAAVGFNF